jgi:broad specificity phosphatase PhoE
MTRITFLRHAEGTHNADALIYGVKAYSMEQNRDALLTEKGIKQAIQASRDFQKQWSAIYCSPLRRCIQTLLHVYPAAASQPVIVDERLSEIPVGIDTCNMHSDTPMTLPSKWIVRTATAYDNVISATEDFPTEGDILIVGHSVWINHWLRVYKQKNIWLANCESITVEH